VKAPKIYFRDAGLLHLMLGIRSEKDLFTHPKYGASGVLIPIGRAQPGKGGDKIDAAAARLVEMYKNNLFPEMKVRWDTHPDNIGHLISDGCFRCHDGGHKSSEGKLISRDCKSCHTIVEQGPAGKTEKNLDGLEFAHPDGGEEWKEMNCSDCHSGGA